MNIVYIDCDRCGEQHEYLATTQYTNAYICPRCSRERSFDDDNPILYPITNEDNK